MAIPQPLGAAGTGLAGARPAGDLAPSGREGADSRRWPHALLLPWARLFIRSITSRVDNVPGSSASLVAHLDLELVEQEVARFLAAQLRNLLQLASLTRAELLDLAHARLDILLAITELPLATFDGF